MQIPVVKTDRLVLRGYRLDDFPHCAAMWADPDVTRHIADGAPRSGEESWKSFLSISGHWELMGFGTWAVDERTTGRLVGSVGFVERMRDRGPKLEDAPELGYGFVSSAGGQGFATESVKAAVEWARSHFGKTRLIAIVAPDNLASIRVAKKCGFTEMSRGLSAGRPRVFFETTLGE
jgi:RimJ/RimL family protein N-acetyltransferase